MNYKKFKVEAGNDDTRFKVLVKGWFGWFGWKSGYVYTSYFGISYQSKQEALDAIQKYKDRFTSVQPVD